MKKLTSGVAILVLALVLSPAGIALAGDENVTAEGAITFAEDANQGRGVQTNADDWEDMPNALAGSGAQNVNTSGAANTGSGTQDNTTSTQDDWYSIDNVNTDSGAQVLRSTNSNGGDRISNDQIIDGLDGSMVATAALEAAVSGNSVAVSGDFGAADSSMSMAGDSDFNGLSGVSAVAIGSGDSASQNVGVNVTASLNGG
ncbi:MAG: hypothetical protein VX466_15060 [Myxococcota bacterium]|nr:hypothetical protein [Myxococcota bacterium]